MHGIKGIASTLSLTALVCLFLSSPFSASATQVVRNASSPEKPVIFHSGSEEGNNVAHVALGGVSMDSKAFQVEHGLKVLKRHRKKHHNHLHHHKHHDKDKQEEKCDASNDDDDNNSSSHKDKDTNKGNKKNGGKSKSKSKKNSKKAKSGKTKSSSSSSSSTPLSSSSSSGEHTNNDFAEHSSTKNKSSSKQSSKEESSSGNSNSSFSDDDSTVSSTSGSGSYKRVQQNRGSNFWSGGNWDFWSQSDPTHGQVAFASESLAKSQSLIGMKNGAAFMRASNKDIRGSNRPSVRFQSKKAYDSGLIIFDVVKMPVGCATWPALWTTKGDSWPTNGEIDVLEGTGYSSGGKDANQMTVHLAQNSPLLLNRRGGGGGKLDKRGASFVGKLMSGASNCNQWGGGSNTGCAFFDSNSNGPSWGTNFNSAGGGVWAMQFGNDQGVKIWFWGRKSSKLPNELSQANVSPEKLDPTSWGTPMANFQSKVINKMINGQVSL